MPSMRQPPCRPDLSGSTLTSTPMLILTPPEPDPPKPPARAAKRTKAPKPPAAPRPEAPHEIGWRTWRAAYRAAKGTPYASAARDGKNMPELVARAQELLADMERPATDLEPLLVHRWGRYLDDPGRDNYLVREKHPLWCFDGGAAKYGTPWDVALPAGERHDAEPMPRMLPRPPGETGFAPGMIQLPPPPPELADLPAPRDLAEVKARARILGAKDDAGVLLPPAKRRRLALADYEERTIARSASPASPRAGRVS